MNRRSVLNAVIIILAFLAAFYGNRILSGLASITFTSDYLRVAWYYAWWIVPTVLITGILFGFKSFFANLGLNRGFITGFIFALATVSPMLISSAIIGPIREGLTWFPLLLSTLFAGFMEEFLFRGFLFGLLFRKVGWGFIPASVLGALIFGLGHVYQGTNLTETAAIFFITAIGAVWYAWLYAEWNNNLWVPVFLHILMNLSWTLFDVSDNALGDLYPNLFRAVTIALTVIITIRHNKKSGMKINRGNLFVNARES